MPFLRRNILYRGGRFDAELRFDEPTGNVELMIVLKVRFVPVRGGHTQSIDGQRIRTVDWERQAFDAYCNRLIRVTTTTFNEKFWLTPPPGLVMLDYIQYQGHTRFMFMNGRDANRMRAFAAPATIEGAGSHSPLPGQVSRVNPRIICSFEMVSVRLGQQHVTARVVNLHNQSDQVSSYFRQNYQQRGRQLWLDSNDDLPEVMENSRLDGVYLPYRQRDTVQIPGVHEAFHALGMEHIGLERRRRGQIPNTSTGCNEVEHGEDSGPNHMLCYRGIVSGMTALKPGFNGLPLHPDTNSLMGAGMDVSAYPRIMAAPWLRAIALMTHTHSAAQSEDWEHGVVSNVSLNPERRTVSGSSIWEERQRLGLT